VHVELVIPGLFRTSATAPTLEMLLARGRRSEAAPASPEDWLSGAFGLPETHLPADALSTLAYRLKPDAAH